jgi:hypothetical protein
MLSGLMMSCNGLELPEKLYFESTIRKATGVVKCAAAALSAKKDTA